MSIWEVRHHLSVCLVQEPELCLSLGQSEFCLLIVYLVNNFYNITGHIMKIWSKLSLVGLSTILLQKNVSSTGKSVKWWCLDSFMWKYLKRSEQKWWHLYQYREIDNLLIYKWFVQNKMIGSYNISLKNEKYLIYESKLLLKILNSLHKRYFNFD